MWPKSLAAPLESGNFLAAIGLHFHITSIKIWKEDHGQLIKWKSQLKVEEKWV